ncbi:MAG: methylthioadenosine phosphorylase [Candidatus Schekmanbacteria bacterium RIFCSPHIGHO2_02_FULL_38_11]|uniref:S-methyl-5'-thioadenosine phosphorylase n=1 Tax=Candidatus Schekmanbacteria bacterium RIFCSPLOWO2_12_FULL_38_15 TaxID=1817883 RepID=A0A1F7SQB5_9BACT|nr:MAG: methylthioadenosine phosphorylase [Candidatus Schekmanbacteria bacterium GWA2_38_9]OGL48214.1 MAG: methylthioadenosine phosphorylase [Candidatus Schekmanbacteria bacterium RIFCSPLOWO2_02_FULL_38_14]OGL54660.1 MAG: methylthioadenosine phosphorylase [Candidatus Schekmanbacteria bacterium RIFCSPHIGHO2_02_FULL_38_11]OGL55384.1 MAG: methylthioadenosine phosphorylase [Candidatus Schekmanbacteria bacterium RIFCSPLOWO2_12_FULL_38_15]
MGKIGVIGGSGLYEMKDLKEVKEAEVKTPFGKPSDKYIMGELDGKEMVFLPRHGKGHRILPHEINFRANIYGMKKLGVEWIISVSAVGSMKKEIRPGDIVIPDQFYDRTKTRISTFFGNGIAGHIQFADPICDELACILYSSAKEAGARVHKGGTYICIEGPQFSTRGESLIYRKWGVDVIGMTNIPEAKLAREAEICYGTIALATDYDCWHEEEEDVTIDAVLEIIRKNVKMAQSIIRNAVKKIKPHRKCSCPESLKYAIITAKDKIPAKIKKDLKQIFGKYL